MGNTESVDIENYDLVKGPFYMPELIHNICFISHGLTFFELLVEILKADQKDPDIIARFDDETIASVEETVEYYKSKLREISELYAKYMKEVDSIRRQSKGEIIGKFSFSTQEYLQDNFLEEGKMNPKKFLPNLENQGWNHDILTAADGKKTYLFRYNIPVRGRVDGQADIEINQPVYDDYVKGYKYDLMKISDVMEKIPPCKLRNNNNVNCLQLKLIGSETAINIPQQRPIPGNARDNRLTLVYKDQNGNILGEQELENGQLPAPAAPAAAAGIFQLKAPEVPMPYTSDYYRVGIDNLIVRIEEFLYRYQQQGIFTKIKDQNIVLLKKDKKPVKETVELAVALRVTYALMKNSFQKANKYLDDPAIQMFLDAVTRDRFRG